MKGSPTATSPRSSANAGRGAERPGALVRVQTQTVDGASGVLPIRASPSPCAQSAAMETHGCDELVGGALRAALRVQPDEAMSRPDAVIRATSVPSAISAMVYWPSTQSGPWNSASMSVIGVGSARAPGGRAAR